MTFAQWMGMAVAAALLCMVVRVHQPQMAGLIAMTAGLMLTLSALASLTDLQGMLLRLSTLGGLQEGALGALMKVLGVSWTAEMASRICEDLGENGLSRYVALAGRLSVFALVAPMLISMLEMILELAP